MTELTPNSDARTLAATLAPRLALLRAIGEHGNLTTAARDVGIPQPTASRWLVGMSAELGMPVAVRDGRGIRLSRAGEYLADAASGALSTLEGGARRAIDETDPERGQVVLAFLHTMGEVRVPELLRAFRAEHPMVRFTLSQGSLEYVLERVGSGTADLALTSPRPTGDEFESAHLDDQPLVATVPAGHRLADRDGIRLAELADDQFIGLKFGYGLRRITMEMCAEAGFVPQLAFEGEECDTLRGLVAAGLGVAILPTAAPTAVAGIVELPLVPAASREIGVAWAANRPLSPSAAAFLDFATLHTGR